MDVHSIEARLREMALAYKNSVILVVRWKSRNFKVAGPLSGYATCERHPHDPHRSCKTTSKFRVSKGVLFFLGERSNLKKPFHKTEHFPAQLWVNDQRIL